MLLKRSFNHKPYQRPLPPQSNLTQLRTASAQIFSTLLLAIWTYLRYDEQRTDATKVMMGDGYQLLARTQRWNKVAEAWKRYWEGSRITPVPDVSQQASTEKPQSRHNAVVAPNQPSLTDSHVARPDIGLRPNFEEEGAITSQDGREKPESDLVNCLTKTPKGNENETWATYWTQSVASPYEPWQASVEKPHRHDAVNQFSSTSGSGLRSDIEWDDSSLEVGTKFDSDVKTVKLRKFKSWWNLPWRRVRRHGSETSTPETVDHRPPTIPTTARQAVHPGTLARL